MDIKILKLQRSDLELAKKLFSIFNKVFGEEGVETSPLPNDNYLTRLLSQTSFHVLVAMSGDEVMGGLTGYEMTMYLKEEKELFLYDLAVSDEFRRQGVASKLLTALKKYAVEYHVATIFLEADEEDVGAIEFYRSIGGIEKKVNHFNFSLSGTLQTPLPQ